MAACFRRLANRRDSPSEMNKEVSMTYAGAAAKADDLGRIVVKQKDIMRK